MDNISRLKLEVGSGHSTELLSENRFLLYVPTDREAMQYHLDVRLDFTSRQVYAAFALLIRGPDSDHTADASKESSAIYHHHTATIFAAEASTD